MLTMSSKAVFPRSLIFFYFSLSLGDSLRTWWWSGQRYQFHMRLSLLNGRFHYNFRPVSPPAALVSHHQPFLKRGSEGWWQPQHWLPYRCSSGTRLDFPWGQGGMAEAARVGWTQMQDNQRKLKLGLQQTKCQAIPGIFTQPLSLHCICI